MYQQSGQRINSIAQQYVPYQNLINRSPVYVAQNQISLSPNRAIPHYNNPVYYSSPYQNLLRNWFNLILFDIIYYGKRQFQNNNYWFKIQIKLR